MIIMKARRRSQRWLCRESKQRKKNPSMAHDSNRDYRNLNKTILHFFYFLCYCCWLHFGVCVCCFSTFFDYQPIIKTSILSRLIACSHLILCCRRRRCVLSLLRRFRVLFYRFRYKVCRFVSHFFWSGFSFIQLKIMSHWQRQW